MKNDLPDIITFEQRVFKSRKPLKLLLSYCIRLMQARHVGLLYGTNKTYVKYLPPEKWDRGVMHLFNGAGFSGFVLKYFGRKIVQYKGLSPVRLYKRTQQGGKQESKGIISYVLRKHSDYYGQGVKVMIIDIPVGSVNEKKEDYSDVSLLSYDGRQFQPVQHLKVNNAIVRQFNSRNFVSAYVPDYGAIVFNTINPSLIARKENRFLHDDELKVRLNRLIEAIEMGSLAHIGRARGKQSAQIIWRKEKRLRQTAIKLTGKEKELEAQRKYLRAVGAVDEKQLNMDAVNLPDGVYAFMDMVGSARIRNHFSARDYFFILNCCHQIAADTATRFSCRIDNFIGDGVFLQNVSIFDRAHQVRQQKLPDRIMLMVFALSSIINQINELKMGNHPLDSSRRASDLIKNAGVDLGFRAGLESGSAMIGPLGSEERKIVTAIGKTVNNASRYESSGSKNKIHLSRVVVKILEQASITNENPILWRLMTDGQNPSFDEEKPAIPFWGAFCSYFNVDKADLVEEQTEVQYKEFSSRGSCLIRCLGDSG